MVLVADELKRKWAEIDIKIEELRAHIVSLERQQAAFDVVIQAYEPEYSPDGTSRHATRHQRRGFEKEADQAKQILSECLDSACTQLEEHNDLPSKVQSPGLSAVLRTER